MSTEAKVQQGESKPADKPDAFPSINLNPARLNPEPRQLPPIKLVLDEYNFKNPRRGRAVIINQKNFDQRLTGQQDRDGTDIDAANLESVFTMLGFDVLRYDNLTTLDLSINLRQLSSEDHSDVDCFVGAILSHGEEGYVYGTNGRVSIDSIIKNFKGDNCPSLAGKPKLFFIQACRGRKYDWGVEVADSDMTDSGQIEEPFVRKVPVEADVLLAYSVVPGYFSWRNNVDGSWFIQALIKVFQEHWDRMELMQMMTLVSKVVAYDFQSCTDDDFTSNMKQVPCMVSTLTKQVFFRPK